MKPRHALYAFVFVFSPIMVGMMLAVSSLSDYLIHERPESLGEKHQPHSYRLDPKKKNVGILLSEDGVQTTDLLLPYEALARSGQFNVFTIAPDQNLIGTTSMLAIEPDFSYKNTPPLDLLVVPALMDPANPKLQNFLKTQLPEAKKVLSICEGARSLGEAGYLDGKKYTTHFNAFGDLQRHHPQGKLVQNRRFVVDGDLISSAGISASLDGAIAAVSELASPAIAARVAKEMGLSQEAPSGPRTSVTIGEFFTLFFRGGFDWQKEVIGLALAEGVNEQALAAALDIFPRAFSNRVFTFAEDRVPIRTMHGLTIVPFFAESAAPIADEVLLLSGNYEEGALKSFRKNHGDKVKDYTTLAAESLYPQFFGYLEESAGPTLSGLAAKMVETSWKPSKDSFSADWPIEILIRPLLIGLLGILIARILLRQVQHRMSGQPGKK